MAARDSMTPKLRAAGRKEELDGAFAAEGGAN